MSIARQNMQWLHDTVEDDLLLNLFPNPSIAYSLRKLDLNYTGFAIQARRSSDNALQNIPFLANGNLDINNLLLFGKSSQAVVPAPFTNASGVDAIYSLRLANSDYTGDSIRVRRDSDNAEQDIGFLANGDLDQTALTTFVGANNGFVRTIYDQSGNGVDVLQTNTAKQPQIVTAGVVNLKDGKPTVRFDGTDDNLTSTASLPTSPTDDIFIFIALAQTALTQTNTNFNINSPSEVARVSAHLPFTTLGHLWDAGGAGVGQRLVAGGQNNTNNNQITLIKQGGTNGQKIRQNGALLAQQTPSVTSTPVGQITIGDFNDNTVIPAHMDWQEMITFTSDQTANLTAIEENQGLYWVSALATNDDVFISILYDQSGNGINATQGNINFQPQIISAGSLLTENGLPAFETTPTRFLVTGGITSLGSQILASLFTVHSIPGYDNATFFIDLEEQGRNLETRIIAAGVGALVNIAPVVDLGSGILPDTNQHYLTSVFRKQGDSNIFVNGVFGTQSGAGLDNFAANPVISIGRRNDGLFATTCRWAEIILYNTDEIANRTFIENNQKDYYGTP